MAASAIDEAVRNCVVVGADPTRIALLDNFCWGYTDRPETLGSLVRAAVACQEVATALGTPFISGKDSLNNEFRYQDLCGTWHAIAIPPSLLISALGQVDDVRSCITMDLKQEANWLYLVGETKDELGGSHFAHIHGMVGGCVPQVDSVRAKVTFSAIYRAIHAGLVRACHDLSEGGLAVAVAEMAFAGGCGADVRLGAVPHRLPRMENQRLDAILLFAESNTRFLCEVPQACREPFEALMAGLPHGCVGTVTNSRRLTILSSLSSLFSDPALAQPVVSEDVAELKAAWQAPLHW
jgi:phosphoribosylformylglycinamidine synthase